MHPGDLAGGFSDLEMTWLLYCAGAVTDIIEIVDIAKGNQAVIKHSVTKKYGETRN